MDSIEQKTFLSELGVHDLRNLARSYGVKSPTSKVKEQLISDILAVMNSSTKLTFTEKTRGKGRPTKSHLYELPIMPEAIKKLSLERIFLKNKKFENDRSLVFCSPIIETHFTHFETKSGYLRQVEEDYYLVEPKTDVVAVVPTSIVIENKLELGDFLEVNAKYISTDLFYTTEVVKINSVLTKENNRELCSIKDILPLKNTQKINNITEGDKVYFQSYDYADFANKIAQTSIDFNKKGFEVRTLGVRLGNMETYQIEQNIAGEHLLSQREDEPLESYETITNAVNNATVLAREGKKVVLIIIGLKEVIAEIETFFNFQKLEKKDMDLSVLKLSRKIISLNRTLKNSGSITTIICSEEEQCSQL